MNLKTMILIRMLALGLWLAVFAAECAAVEPFRPVYRLDLPGLN